MKAEEIIGKWEFKNGKAIAYANCKIIELMIENELTKLESSNDGWTTLYKRCNGEIWELSYPKNHWHGGGPQKLVLIQS
jgi:hypothetical protein